MSIQRSAPLISWRGLYRASAWALLLAGCCPEAPTRPVPDWTDDIWGLEGQNPYPDDETGVPGIDAVIGSAGGNFDTVFLDITVFIAGLEIPSDFTLRVTQVLGRGDLFVQELGVRISGSLLTGRQRLIEIDGPMLVRAGGLYAAEPCQIFPVDTRLFTEELTVEPGPPCAAPGSVVLTESMELHVSGDLVLEDDEGDCTPPDFIVTDDGVLTIGGSLIIVGDANVQYDSTVDMCLAGNFDNFSTVPSTFEWSGGVVLTGSCETPRTAGSHTFEVAGADLGAVEAGFNDNFAMGRVELDANNDVTFQDTFDNVTSTCEALYLGTLVLLPGSEVTIDNVAVYYRTLDDQRTNRTFEISGPCGALELVPQ